jgi:3-hydroxybutyryl-CoA dehydrogenase
MSTGKRIISVIGAGAMGSGIAQFLSQHNVSVRIIEQNTSVLKQVRGKIADQFDSLKEHDLILESEIQHALDHITISGNLEDARDSWMIIEAIPENLELKQNLFLKLEEMCDSTTIFATNTSGLSVNEIGRGLKHPDRIVGTHFFMPATVVPLVEIIRGKNTSDSVCDQVMQFFKDIDKKPVLVKRDIPGFIANRIQHAMAREAIALLEEGIATAEEIDTVVRWSIGVRMLFTGPLEQRDLNGLDVHYHIASYLYEDLENRTTPSNLLTEKVEKGEWGIKSGKGFYEWKDVDTQAVVQQKNRELLQLMRWLKN